MPAPLHTDNLALGMAVHLPAIGAASSLPPQPHPPAVRLRSASLGGAELAAAARLHSASLLKQPPQQQPQSVSFAPILLFIKVFGSGVEARSMQVDVALACTLRELKSQLAEQLPHLQLMRLLYAGRLLSDDERTLSSYELYKEATIQALTRPKTEEELAQDRRKHPPQKLVASENAQPGQQQTQSPAKRKWGFLRRKVSEQFSPPPKRPLSSLLAQPQRLMQSLVMQQQQRPSAPPQFDPVESMQFGEAIVVSVLAARGIKSSGSAFRSSGSAMELYVLCVLQGSTCRGSTRKSSVAAAAPASSSSSSSTSSAVNGSSVEWNETMGLWRQIVPIPQTSHSAAGGGRASAIQRARAFAAAANTAAASAASSSVAAACSMPVAPAAPAAPAVQAHKRDRLHVLLFAHDFLSADEPLGHVQLSVDSLALAGPGCISKPTWHALGGAQGGGELLLQVERCTLSSQQMLVAWQAAIKDERALPLVAAGAVQPASVDPSQAALATHNSRLLRAIRVQSAFNLPVHLQHQCMTELQKQTWAAMQLALRQHEGVSAVRKRLESTAAATAAVTESGSNVPSPIGTPRSISGFTFAAAAAPPPPPLPPPLAMLSLRNSTGAAFGSNVSCSSLHSSPLLQFSSGSGSSSRLLSGSACASSAAALPAALWNPALFHLEQCLLRSLHQLSAATATATAANLPTALSPLFASPVSLQLVWHTLLSQRMIVPPSAIPAPAAPRFSRMLWVTHLPLDLTAREFHALLFQPLSLPSPLAVAAPVAAGSVLAVKSYVYSARARMAFVVCSNAEQATLCMLRLRGMILAANALAAPPLFVFAAAPDECAVPASVALVQSAAHVGFINVRLPTTVAAAGGSSLKQSPQSAGGSFRRMLLHLDSEGVLRGFDCEQLLGSRSSGDEGSNQQLTPAFTLRITPTPASFGDGSAASPRISSVSTTSSSASGSNSSSMILLRTAPLSFEIVCNNHASVYRFQMGSAASSASSSFSSSSSSAAAAVQDRSAHWPAFGLGKSDVDRWMTELKALRGAARSGIRRPSMPAVLDLAQCSSSSSTSIALAPLPAAACDVVHEIEAPLRFCCVLCKGEVQPEALYRLDQHHADQSTHTCRPCLAAVARQRFLSSASSSSSVSAVAAAPAASSLDFSTLDLSDLLSKAEYAEYVESSTQRLLAPLRPRTLSFAEAETMVTPSIATRFEETTSLDPVSVDAMRSQGGSRFTQCPSCHIHIAVDSVAQSGALELDDAARAWWSKQIGVDGQPPSEESYELFVRARVLCRSNGGGGGGSSASSAGCGSSFCALCLASPFHLGLSCAEFVEFAQAPKCRFCLTGAVTSRNRLEGPPAEVLAAVCGAEECKLKSAASCLKRHQDCGHVCGGVRNESQCLPCLDPACVSLRPSLTNSVDAAGECGICFTEALGQAPAIRLDSCGHIMHLSCILERIRANWSGDVEAGCNEGFRQMILAGSLATPPPAEADQANAMRGEPRVHFTFLGCALCGVRMAHGSSSSAASSSSCSSSSSSSPIRSSLLSEVMAPYLAFESMVHKLAAEQFLVQNLAAHAKWGAFRSGHEDTRRQRLDKRTGAMIATNASGAPAETLFAMDQLSFYACFECKKPYFAGARECGPADGAAGAAGGAGVLSSELLCSSCSSQSSLDHCALHGSDWLLFKCRFCCAASTYHCWNNTHFCNACHEQDVWPTLCVFASGKNSRRIYEYPQCGGIAKQMAKILKDKSLRTPEDKEAACAALLSDPASCPLRVRHRPNGLEFGLGCAMCKDAKAESCNRRKEIEVAQAKRTRMQALRKRMQNLIPAPGTSSSSGGVKEEACLMLLPIELQSSSVAPVTTTSSLYDLSSMEDLPCFASCSNGSSAAPSPALSPAPSPPISPKRALSLRNVDWAEASMDKPAVAGSLLKPSQAPQLQQANKENVMVLHVAAQPPAAPMNRALVSSSVVIKSAQGRGAKLLQQHQQRAPAPAASASVSSAVALAPHAKRAISMGLVQYLGTDAGSHPYINPADPSLPSSGASSYLCDISLSSLDESLQPPPTVPGVAAKPAPVWRCLNDLDGVMTQSQPTAVRTRSYPFSSVQLQVFHLALQVTHYALYLPVPQIDSNGLQRFAAPAPVAAANPPPSKVLKSASASVSSSSCASVASPALSASDCGVMTSWRLEGSNAGVHWEVIDERVNDSTLLMHARAAEAATVSSCFSSLSLLPASTLQSERRRVLFAVPSTSAALARRFSLFRLVQTDFASAASCSSSTLPSHALSCHGLELFGALYPAISDADYLAHSEAALEAKLHDKLTKRGGTFTLPLIDQPAPAAHAAAAPVIVSITPGLDVPLSLRGMVALNRGSAKWRAIRVEDPIWLSAPFGSSAAAGAGVPVPSVYTKSFRILFDPSTSNSWHWTIGVVSAGFNFNTRCWIGAQSGSWGYIAGTGGVCHASGLSAEYGRPYGLGDVVSVRVDVTKGTCEFARNGVWQGVAFRNLPRMTTSPGPAQPPLFFAVAMHAVRAHIQIE